jgi:hypothetical protein
MQARGLGIQSKPRKVRNAPGARTRERVVDYRKFDQGRSRPAHNRRIRETQADYWAAIDTDDIVRRWQKEDRAKAATARNIVGRLPIEHNPGRSDARLDGIQKPGQPQRAMTRPSHSSKANAMDEEEKRRRYLEHVLREAETAKQLTGGAFLNAVDKSYIDPDKAKERMEKLRQAKGERAVEEKLQNQPGRFGRRPASILSPDGYKRGAGGRREDASEARESLPHLLREYRDQRDRADAAQRALGKQPSFSESLAQRRAGNEPSQQDKAQDKEKERAEQLERWKREREQGRKR